MKNIINNTVLEAANTTTESCKAQLEAIKTFMESARKQSYIPCRVKLDDVQYDKTTDTFQATNVQFVKRMENGVARDMVVHYGLDEVSELTCYQITLDANLMQWASMHKAECGGKKKALAHGKTLVLSIMSKGMKYNGHMYLPAQFSASNQRNAECVFFRADKPEDVMQLLEKVTKLNYTDKSALNYAGTVLGDKKHDGKCLITKALSRESQRSATSQSIFVTLNKIAEEARNGEDNETNQTILKAVDIAIKVASGEDVDGIKGMKCRVFEDLEVMNRQAKRNPMTKKLIKDEKEFITKAIDGGVLIGRKGMLIIGLAFGLIAPALFIWAMQNISDNAVLTLIKGVNSFIQGRLRSGKFGSTFADVDKFVFHDDKFCDVIVFDSARKYEDGEWKFIELEVCNVSHKGKGTVVTDNPLLGSLIGGPNADVTAADDIIKMFMDKIDGIFSKDIRVSCANIKFILNSLQSVYDAIIDDDNSTEEDVLEALAKQESVQQNLSIVQKAIDTNMLLIHDKHILDKLSEHITSFALKMMAAKFPVPGANAPIMADPNAIIKMLIAKGELTGTCIVIPTLKSGEYYYNNKSCRSIICRSPVTHYDQVKIITLVENEAYSVYHDVLLMNVEDSLWIWLSGADHDGDKVKMIFEEETGEFKKEWMTKLFTQVYNREVFNYEPGQEVPEKQYVDFTWENRLHFIAENLVPSQVGILNNCYSNWLELLSTLGNLKSAALHEGVSKILFDRNYSAEDICRVDTHEDERVLFTYALPNVKSLQEIPFYKTDSEGNVIVEKKNFVFKGIMTLDDINSAIKVISAKIDKLEIFQSREVDKPKTGIGVTDDELQSIQINLLSYANLMRRFEKGKLGNTLEESIQKANDKADACYCSFSLIGHITDMVSLWYNGYNETVGDNTVWVQSLKEKIKGIASTKLGEYVYRLLTERETMYVQDILPKIRAYRGKYNSVLMKMMKDNTMDEDLKREKIHLHREAAIKALHAAAEKSGCPITAVAAAVYISCYTGRNDNKSSGYSFGWLLEDELLVVFKRGDHLFDCVHFPYNNSGFVSNSVVFACDDTITDVRMICGNTAYYDQDIKTFWSMNGKRIALLRRKPVKVINAEETMYDSELADNDKNVPFKGITLLHCEPAKVVEAMNNDWTFKVTVNASGDEANGACVLVGYNPKDKTQTVVFGDIVLPGDRHLKLVNRYVKLINDGTLKTYDASIKNITAVLFTPVIETKDDSSAVASVSVNANKDVECENKDPFTNDGSSFQNVIIKDESSSYVDDLSSEDNQLSLF